jgi:hypothetical protein
LKVREKEIERQRKTVKVREKETERQRKREKEIESYLEGKSEKDTCCIRSRTMATRSASTAAARARQKNRML